MAKVIAKVDCFVGNALRKAGDVFEYVGAVNANLTYIEEKPAVKVENKVNRSKTSANS